MHSRFLAIFSLVCFLPVHNSIDASSVNRQGDDGSSIQTQASSRPLDHNHEENLSILLLSTLEQDGKSRTQADSPSFILPLRRGLSNNDPGFFKIAAFVDHGDAFPDSLLDWNCGERTYDAANFNHNGTDYNAAQYPWLTMDNDGLVVVAATDGEIVERRDGEFDKNCSFDPNSDANRILLKHIDGSLGIYAHMKTGTVTPRKVGDMVEKGDYLGVVGSSGLSNGPHLHFGVQDLAFNLFDPYAGTCNELNNDSFWADQEPYYKKEILSLATHSAFPERPACPGLEKPNYKDVFAQGEEVLFFVTVRDYEGTDEVHVEVRGPSDEVIFSSTRNNESIDYETSYSFINIRTFQNTSAKGKYIYRATFGGQTEEHEFYVGMNPPPPPEATPANNAFTGLWYDSALDGEGFNVVTSESGTIVYFYGSDNRGNRLWLISDLIQGEIETGESIEVLMFESSGGVFPTPVPSSRGLAAWGTMNLLFNDCMNGQSTLSGMDGSKVSKVTKLAGVGGASCVEGDVPVDSGWAGLWYDPTKDGEGYNLIVAPVGRILYYYGFTTSGLRLWLISELITEALEVGKTVEITMFRSTQGTFSSPVPSDQALAAWGTAKITVVDCDNVTIVINGADGAKTSNTLRLAGIIGLSCG